MNVLITGGAGFIGSNLAKLHLDNNDYVTIIDNFSSGSHNNLLSILDNPKYNTKFKIIKEDLLISDQLTELTKWADRIYHLAAIVGLFQVLQDPLQVLRTNILACEKLLHASTNNKNVRIIIFSSSSVYGSSSKEYMQENNKVSLQISMKGYYSYAASKIIDEFFSLAYLKSFGLAITVVRLFNTIGPNQTGLYGMVVPRFINQAKHNNPITVFGDGLQTRSFCDVRDTIIACKLLADTSLSIGKIVNVGNLQEITIIDLAKKIKLLAKSSSKIINIPLKQAYGQEYEEIRSRKPDLNLLHQLIDFEPKWTLDETIKTLL